MKYLKQLAVIFLICVVGQLFSNLIGNVIPGNVLAMILLFILLLSKIIKLENIAETSDYLLTNMAFLFLPPTVSIFFQFHLFEGIMFRFIIFCLVATILTSLSAGFTVKLILKLQKKKKGGNV